MTSAVTGMNVPVDVRGARLLAEVMIEQHDLSTIETFGEFMRRVLADPRMAPGTNAAPLPEPPVFDSAAALRCERESEAVEVKAWLAGLHGWARDSGARLSKVDCSELARLIERLAEEARR